MDLDASNRIGVATTVGTYKVRSAHHVRSRINFIRGIEGKTPGADLFMEIFEENAAIWRFTMNGLHLKRH